MKKHLFAMLPLMAAGLVGVAQAATEGLLPWPDAAGFRGLLLPEPDAPRGTAIVFHGNAGHAGQRRLALRALVF